MVIRHGATAALLSALLMFGCGGDEGSGSDASADTALADTTTADAIAEDSVASDDTAHAVDAVADASPGDVDEDAEEDDSSASDTGESDAADALDAADTDTDALDDDADTLDDDATDDATDTLDEDATDTLDDDATDTVEADTAVADTFVPDPTPNIVFVTSQKLAPDFAIDDDPTAGADAACAEAATAGGLPGTFVALLNSSAGPLYERVSDASGFVNSLGAPVANSAADLVYFRHFERPAHDEHGAAQESGFWTGKSVSQDNCADWTSTSVGDIGYTGTLATVSQLTFQANPGCNATVSLLCVSVDYHAVVAPEPNPAARLAFLSSASVSPGGGRAAMDAVCQGDFEAAHGTDTGRTFIALVAGDGETAASRLTDESAWVRADDTRLADTNADLASATWRAFLNVQADGSHVLDSNVAVFFGAVDGVTAGSAASTCGGWTADTGDGVVSCATRWPVRLGQWGTRACAAATARVYCVESTPADPVE